MGKNTGIFRTDILDIEKENCHFFFLIKITAQILRPEIHRIWVTQAPAPSLNSPHPRWARNAAGDSFFQNPIRLTLSTEIKDGQNLVSR